MYEKFDHRCKIGKEQVETDVDAVLKQIILLFEDFK